MHLTRLFAGAAGLLLASSVTAQTALEDLPVIGQPEPNGTGFQQPATQQMRDIIWLDSLLLVIITIISLFVVGLLAWVIIRYNEKRNPEPATFTHNSPLEVAWTVIPIVILVFIGAFSLPVLFNQQEIPEGDLTIKVTGHKWFWSYEYVDEGVEFESYMIGQPATLQSNEEAEDYIPEIQAYVLNDAMRERLSQAGYTEDQWLLATDTSVVVPVGATVVMQVTGADYIHSWTVPAFGVKQDAVPGRLAELHFTAEQEGIYFGQCSELCGMYHAYMPITVKVVSQDVYDEWLERVRAESELSLGQRTYTRW